MRLALVSLTLVLILPLLCTTGANADDYDYIRGDEIYGDDYNYGLDYDRLRSVPESPDVRLDGNAPSPESVRERSGAKRENDGGSGALSPSMTRRLEALRQETYPDPHDDAGASDGVDRLPVPGQ